jgi:flavin reductase (DIM6/NTAB) family NADH-FMN oxidoreductase RutF
VSSAAPDPVPSPVDAATFRRVVSRFATGVTVVTAVLDGVDHAMTANAFTSVSLDPVLVLVCVEKEARFHDAIAASGLWGVSVLDASGRRAAEWFATRGRPLIGQLEPYATHRGPHTGASLFDAALATLECRTWASYDGGDHSIVVGEVLAVDLRRPEGEALLYFRSAYQQLG